MSTSTTKNTISQIPLYPIGFEPIYQYRIWGGRRLDGLQAAPLPDNDPIGEAWILSDRVNNASRVADGLLKGQTISQLLEYWPFQLMGKLDRCFDRFLLLLKQPRSRRYGHYAEL